MSWCCKCNKKRSIKYAKATYAPVKKSLEEKADIVCYGIPDWSPYAAFGSMTPILTLISTGLGYLGGMIEAVGKTGCSVIIATPC